MIVIPDLSDINAPERAARAERFIGNLKLTEGRFAGQPFAMPDFQRNVVRKLYGCVDHNGRRRIRTAAIWLPRGCGKTTWASALGLLHLMGPEREAAGQVAVAAADREQAGIAYRSALRTTRADQRLASEVRVQESTKQLVHPKTNSILKAYASESYTAHGAAISLLIADEIHAWQSNNGRELYMTLTQSMGKRAEPLTLIISTAGCGQNSIAWELWDYSLKVARGEVEDDSFLPVIYAADKDDDWKDSAVWQRVNPSIGAGYRDLAEMEVMARRAAEVPAHAVAFKQYYLNIWQEGAAEPWLPMDVFDEGAVPVDEDALAGRPCYVGLDLSSTSDLTAAVAAFPDGEGGYDVLCRAFVPADNIRRRAEHAKVNYPAWVESGHLTATPGNTVDQGAVIAAICDWAERFDVREVALDRWQAASVEQALMAEGLPVVRFGQGFRDMSPAVRELERAILARQFRHGGDPVLRWCIGNVVLDTDPAGNSKITKARAPEKVDLAVAACMALGRALSNDAGPSIYETDRPDGFLFI
ncbi:terminase large subunit [Azospirillum sp. sgz301742]